MWEPFCLRYSQMGRLVAYASWATYTEELCTQVEIDLLAIAGTLFWLFSC